MVATLLGCGRTGLLSERLREEAGFVDPDDEADSGADAVPLDCNRVDFLFVIDNSGSMFDHHTNLVDNVSVFTDGLARLGAERTDFHVGVVTTDLYAGTQDECHEMGGLITRTSGAHSSERECGPFAEGNYLTNADDLEEDFACVAMVGTQGNDIERPMDAMIGAIREDGAAAECNAGFLRPDALLVVVVVTDEWDGAGDPEGDGSSSDSDAWRRSLVDAKGSEDAVVFVALVNEVPRQCWPGFGYNDGTPQVEFAESLPFGFVGSVCGDYGATFTQALDVVAAACTPE